MHLNLLPVFVIWIALSFISCEKYTPILYWHSLGESPSGTEFNTYSQLIKANLENDVYIRTAQLSDNDNADRKGSASIHPLDQIRTVCEMIKGDAKFQNGYNAVGFSQGGLFLRGLAQICPNPPMKNLISMGGPQQGIFQFPRCGVEINLRCATTQLEIKLLAYKRLSQKLFAPATYWHDVKEERYRAGSTFLALINNENQINADYVKNLQALNKFIMVKYQEDIGIVPNESTWFGYYDRDLKVLAMEDTEFYKSNKLPLKAMKDAGKLVFLLSPLGHLKLDQAWFVANIIPLLK